MYLTGRTTFTFSKVAGSSGAFGLDSHQSLKLLSWNKVCSSEVTFERAGGEINYGAVEVPAIKINTNVQNQYRTRRLIRLTSRRVGLRPGWVFAGECPTPESHRVKDFRLTPKYLGPRPTLNYPGFDRTKHVAEQMPTSSFSSAEAFIGSCSADPAVSPAGGCSPTKV